MGLLNNKFIMEFDLIAGFTRDVYRRMREYIVNGETACLQMFAEATSPDV